MVLVVCSEMGDGLVGWVSGIGSVSEEGLCERGSDLGWWWWWMWWSVMVLCHLPYETSLCLMDDDE